MSTENPAKLVRAVRGATTVDRDESAHVGRRVQELLQTVIKVNDIEEDDFISIVFTATPDISSRFPASAARALGFDDVPLLGAQELDVDQALPLCIRLMAHVYSSRSRAEIEHVFLHDAKGLRRDLVR